MRVRTRVGGQKMGDQIVVTNRNVSSSRTTDASGNNDSAFYISPAFSGQGPLTNISACYELFRVNQYRVRWQPSVGTLTTGTLYMGLIDNCDMIAKWNTYGTDKYTIIKSLPNMVSTKLYEQKEISWNKPWRRVRFNCDGTITATVAEQIDRTVAGLFVYLIEGAPASTTVGSFVFEQSIALSGLINPLAITTFNLTGEQNLTGQEMEPLPAAN